MGESWREKAKCSGMGPEFFFPEGSIGGRYSAEMVELGLRDNRNEQEKENAKFCHTCPVEQQCLQWAVENISVQGVLGGKSFQQRRSLRRQLMAGSRAHFVFSS